MKISKRALLYDDIAHMRDVEGMKWREIAEHIGLSIQTVNAYYHDPTGEIAAARKAKADGACLDCGDRTVSDGGRAPDRCHKCSPKALGAARLVAETVRLRERGLLQREIAEEMGCNPVTVYKRLRYAREAA